MIFIPFPICHDDVLHKSKEKIFFAYLNICRPAGTQNADCKFRESVAIKVLKVLNFKIVRKQK
jgi:hypothetical protein